MLSLNTLRCLFAPPLPKPLPPLPLPVMVSVSYYSNKVTCEILMLCENCYFTNLNICLLSIDQNMLLGTFTAARSIWTAGVFFYFSLIREWSVVDYFLQSTTFGLIGSKNGKGCPSFASSQIGDLLTNKRCHVQDVAHNFVGTSSVVTARVF